MIDAVLLGDFAQVRQLVAQGADVEACDLLEDGETALMLAAWGGQTEIVEFLLQQGADVHARDDHDRPVCWWASLNVLPLLLAHGADLNAQDENGETPLIKAAWAGNMEKARWLIEHGANPNLQNEDGETAWDRAYNMGFVYLAEMLHKAMASEQSSPPDSK